MTSQPEIFDSSRADLVVHLAIETTGRHGSLAVMQGQRSLRNVSLNRDQRSAATITPTLDMLLSWCREQNHEIEFLSVAVGPGSFTGLRIGVTTAKSLGYALQLPIVAVDSLAAIAASVFHQHGGVDELWVAIDAYRQQVFAGRFDRKDLLPNLDDVPEAWTAITDYVSLMPDSQWQQQRLARDASAVGLAGDAKIMSRGDGEGASDEANRLLTAECDAVGVGLLGIRAAFKSQFTGSLELVPRYLKASAAEEKSRA